MSRRFVFCYCRAMLVSAAAWAAGQPGGAAAWQQPDAAIAPRYLGTADCRNCHTHSHDPPTERTPWVRQDEYLTWHTFDRHSLAYESLLPSRDGSKPVDRMNHLLGMRAAEDRRCLSCHAPLAGAPSGVDPQHLLAEGVGCESCHGPSERWSTPHRLPEWRGLSPEQKGQLAMNDLRDPLRKARLCVSCHVGDAAGGRFVTHEMYAAGHPPLGGIEIESYARSMPPHWTTLSEKPPELTDDLPYYEADELREAKGVLLGNAVAFEQLMALLEEATGAAANDRDDERWPEFALFDCFACHHDLRRPEFAWRQEPHWAAPVPGRPRAPIWPTALLPVETSSDASQADGPQVLRQLDAALSRQPFGHPAELHRSAGAARQWATSLIASLGDPDGRLTVGDRDTLLRDWFALAQSRVHDFDSARQLAWALERVYLDSMPGAMPSERARVLLDELNDELSLYRPRDIDASLSNRSMVARAEFDPVRFQRRMAELAAALFPSSSSDREP